MEEKEAIADTLAGCNALINMLTYSVIQANNKDLRDTFVTFRNQMEDLQWQIYVVARDKGYYVPAAPAGLADVDAVKTAVSGN